MTKKGEAGMATLSREALLQAAFGVEDVEIPGKGTVKVRALSRSQALQFDGVETDAAVMERRLVAAALVEPKLTEDDVQVWQDSSPVGELQGVVAAIMRLSGMGEEALKEAMQQFRG